MGLALGARCWASETFGRCELGDARRTHRLVTMAGQLAAHTGASPAAACQGDTAAVEGTYRFLRNDAVDPEAIARAGFAATVRALERCRGDILAPEDTTTLSYSHAVREALGDIGGPGASYQRGFMVHSVLALDAQHGTTLGLLEQARWCRDPRERGRKHQRGERAYEDKESAKWEQASRRVAERVGETHMGRVVSVCDREADVYEYLRYKQHHGQRYVVRCAQDRRVDDEAMSALFAALASAPVRGEHSVAIAQRGGKHARKKRLAVVQIRSQTVTLKPPKARPQLGPLTLSAVVVEEVDPPTRDEALSWMLFTSEAVDSDAQAWKVVRWYTLRWRIEDFHKAWKSGAGVEARRLQEPDNLERLAVVLAFVAVRLLQLREWAAPSGPVPESEEADPTPDATSHAACTEVLSDVEWRVLWVTQEGTAVPAQVPSKRWAYKAIANLGGWTDTKRTGRAGWQAMWNGWFRLQERVHGYQRMQALNTT